MKKKLVMLELNELCPHLVSRFIEAGELPNFKKLRDSSTVKETDAGASGEDLNPWVQWVDIHTGMDFDKHGVSKLNEATKLQGSYTWDLLSGKMGVKSWVCGSMNASYGSAYTGRFLPDPWSVDVLPYPHAQMDDVYNYISEGVQGHSNGKASISSSSFVKSALKQGLSLSTVTRLAAQLIGEKVFGGQSWARALALDWIQFDLFKHYYKKEAPEYATLFSNCVAHYQHHYWRDYEPEFFGDPTYKPDPLQAKAMLRAYKNSDAILGKLMDLIDDDTAIVFVTALSQQPYTETERFYYHISSENVFRQQFDIPASVAYKPVMAHQFHLEASSEKEAQALMDALDSYEMDSDEYFHVGNRRLFHASIQGSVIDVQCRCTTNVREDAMFIDTRDGSSSKFYDYFYRMNEVKSGMHSPIGMYWFRQPEVPAKIVEDRCPPAQVHHDVLAYFSSAELS